MRNAHAQRPAAWSLALAAGQCSAILGERAHEHVKRSAPISVDGDAVEERDQLLAVDADDIDRLRERALSLDRDVERQLDR